MVLKEIGRWIVEKLADLSSWTGMGLRALWRWFSGWLATISGSTWRKVAVAFPIAFALYIIIGMMVVNRIDDTLPLPCETPAGGSRTVAVVVCLINREARDHDWTANDPFFLPGWWLDNTPNYQKGMVGALSRFTFELRDLLGRTRGSSAVDDGLARAAGNLSKEPDRWVMDFSTSLLPTTASDTYFREAGKDLAAYNNRVSSGEAVFDKRSDNLHDTLERVASDLGASSAALENYISEHAGGIMPDTGADDLFYQVKGQVYAYTVILSALQKDYAQVIADRQLVGLYSELLVSLSEAATLDPLIVANGAKDGVLANHLSSQGFYLLRARTQLKEITNILLK